MAVCDKVRKIVDEWNGIGLESSVLNAFKLGTMRDTKVLETPSLQLRTSKQKIGEPTVLMWCCLTGSEQSLVVREIFI